MQKPAAWLPSRDYHPDLTLDRLVLIAALLRGIWKRCSELYEPSEGDGIWSLSCRAFERCGFQLKVRSQGEWNWLTVTEKQNMQYVLEIGVIPARFYHGDSADDVPTRYAQPPSDEKVLRQGLLNFGHGMGGLLRFVTKTDKTGVPSSVTLIECDEETQATINRFEIPEAASEAPTSPVSTFLTTPPKPGVELPKPSPRPRGGRVKKSGDDVV